MRIIRYSHRGAEPILNANYRLREEIETVLSTLQLDFGERTYKGKRTGKSSEQPHDSIQDAFVAHNWEKERPIVPGSTQKFDLYKERTAIEVEFSRMEFIYRDFIRFLRSYDAKEIDVGILIVLGKSTKDTFYGYKGQRPDFEETVSELEALRSFISIPIWVLGIEK